MKRFFMAFAEKLLIMTETESGYEVSEHLQKMAPNRLAFDPKNEERIYCGTKKNRLWKSENGGVSWEKSKLEFKSVPSVAINPLTSEIYAGTEPSHLFSSKDDGKLGQNFQEYKIYLRRKIGDFHRDRKPTMYVGLRQVILMETTWLFRLKRVRLLILMMAEKSGWTGWRGARLTRILYWPIQKRRVDYTRPMEMAAQIRRKLTLKAMMKEEVGTI